MDPTDVIMQSCQETELKIHVIEFETYLRVAQSLHLKITNAIDT
jgi:hypothetical protein